MRKRIPINKSIIPYEFDIILGNQNFKFSIDYNFKRGIFTASLYCDGELVCANEPVVYGVPMFAQSYQPGKFPCVNIVPLDESDTEDEVTYKNFQKTVFLTIDDGGETDV